MALAKANKQGKVGRPTKLEELSEKQITLEDIQNLCFKYSNQHGYFWHEMCLAIYDEFGVKVSTDWMDKLDDKEFIGTKKACQAACTRYWTLQMQLGGLPSAAPWVFIMKNVAKWTDKRDITHSGTVTSINQEADQAALDEFKETLKESGK